MIKKDNEMFIENIDTNTANERAKNYLEGLDFILDMYFNCGNQNPDYFWYYRFTKAPRTQEIINYLITYDIPTHKKNINQDLEYLTHDEAKAYINCTIDKNIQEIKNIHGEITYDNLISLNHNNRIMFLHGVNHITNLYPRNRYFLDPIHSFGGKCLA